MHTNLITTMEEEETLGHFKEHKLEERVLTALAYKT